MNQIEASLFGFILELIGHSFHLFFFIKIQQKRGTILDQTNSKYKKILNNVHLIIFSNIFYIIGFFFVAPTINGITFSLVIIAFIFSEIYYEMRRPHYMKLFKGAMIIASISLIVNLLCKCPNCDFCGMSEFITLAFSPYGIALCIFYTIVHFILFILSYYYHFCLYLYSAQSLASLINIEKLIGNSIYLTFTVENQFSFTLLYIIIIGFIVCFSMYIRSLRDIFSMEETGINIGGFFFYFLVAQIFSSTMIYGDPMMLDTFPLVTFIVSAIILGFSMIAICCSMWPLSLYSIPIE